MRTAEEAGGLARLAGLLGLDEGRCPGCRAPGLRPGRLLCPDCLKQAKPRLGGYCPVCGHLFALEDEPPHLCGDCLENPRPWERLYFHGRYTGLLREIVLRFKFNRGLAHTRLLTALMLQAFDRTDPPDVIVPVPLHGRRLAWRGYNQSLEPARGLGRSLGAPVVGKALSRVRHTIPQTRLDGKARKENLRGAFAARPELVRGKDVLLVDDVVTTGATLEECARTLKAAGCARVRALAAARA